MIVVTLKMIGILTAWSVFWAFIFLKFIRDDEFKNDGKRLGMGSALNHLKPSKSTLAEMYKRIRKTSQNK